MNKKAILLLSVVFLVLFLASGALFIVDEREKAIKFRFGEIVSSEFDPGLHFKVPFVNNVRTFNARLLTLDIERERFLTSEKKNLNVDSFVKNFPCVRLVQAGDDPGKRRFATATLAHKPQRLTLVDMQTDIINSLQQRAASSG